MRTLLVLGALAIMAVGYIAAARAHDCSTTCYNYSNGSSQCTTHCW